MVTSSACHSGGVGPRYRLISDADSGSPFFGALDPSRIGMTGHSFGGFTTYFVAQDPRIKVAVPMAPAVPPGANALDVPSLHMISTLDSRVNNDAVRTNTYV